jgi:uncharacterized protein (TIGR03067 family)
MMFLAVGSAWAAVLLTAGAPNDLPVNAQMANLAGAWRCVYGEADGHQAADAALAQMKLILRADGTYRNETGDSNTSEGTFAVYPGPETWMMDLKCKKGPQAGKTLYCIYERKGDELRLCYALFGTDRPTEFTSGPGVRHILTVYKRDAAK